MAQSPVREGQNEEDLSAQPPETEVNPWFSRADEFRWRSPCNQSSARQGPQTSVCLTAKWTTRFPKRGVCSSAGISGSCTTREPRIAIRGFICSFTRARMTPLLAWGSPPPAASAIPWRETGPDDGLGKRFDSCPTDCGSVTIWS